MQALQRLDNQARRQTTAEGRPCNHCAASNEPPRPLSEEINRLGKGFGGKRVADSWLGSRAAVELLHICRVRYASIQLAISQNRSWQARITNGGKVVGSGFTFFQFRNSRRSNSLSDAPSMGQFYNNAIQAPFAGMVISTPHPHHVLPLALKILSPMSS